MNVESLGFVNHNEMTLIIVFSILFALLTVAELFFAFIEADKARKIVKPFLMFVATLLCLFLFPMQPFLYLGCFFGLLGDVFLDIKYINTTKETLWTSLGFCAFGVGHIFFITGLFTCFFNFSLNVLYIIIPIIIALALTTLSLLMEKFTPIRYKNMKPFVIVYGFLLFFVTAIYFSGTIQSGWQNMTLLIFSMGLVMFALSDLILNNTYFAPGFNTPAFVISNHIIYYIAQFAIAASLMFLL